MGKMLNEFFNLAPEKQAQILDLEDPEDKIDDDIGLKLKRIFYKNHVGLLFEELGEATKYYLLVNTSMINHSCNPNSVIVVVAMTENIEPVRVVTWVDIKKE